MPLWEIRGAGSGLTERALTNATKKSHRGHQGAFTICDFFHPCVVTSPYAEYQTLKSD